MTAENRKPKRDDNCAGVAVRAFDHARRESGPRSAAPRGWLPEGHGFDRRTSAWTAMGGIGIEHLQYEKVPVEQARMVLEGADAAAAPGNPSRSLRRSPPEALQDATVLWLAELPENMRPPELAKVFPRIANKLCGLWTNPALCNRYLASLLMESRDGARVGFPLRVAAELAALIRPDDTSVKERPWDHVKDIR